MRSSTLDVGACCLLLATLSGSGCDAQRAENTDDAEAAVVPVPTQFDAQMSGAIQGQVQWTGELPTAPTLEGYSNPVIENGPRSKILSPNPNLPRIDASSGGVGSAVVFLRGVDPKSAKNWDHGPVRVTQRGYRLRICEGDRESPYGFVRVGDKVTMDSDDACFHSLHASGAAFFGLTFPEPHQPLTRKLKQRGIVELTSGAGYYWMRAYLFVADVPYLTATDARGKFVLDQVPAGEYDLVSWLPNWREEHHERDPETSLITRFFFRRPLQISRRVKIQPQSLAEQRFEVSADMFDH